MASNHGDFEGFPSASGYCDNRMRKYVAVARKPNETYSSIYKQFIRWFDEKRLHFPIVTEEEAAVDQQRQALTTRTSDQGTVFVTQRNVDLYFSTYLVSVPTSTLQAMRRIVSGLTWVLQRVEDRSASSLLFSDRINRAMGDQQLHHVAYRTEAYSGSDPHNGLKDLYSPEQTLELVCAIWEKRLDSLDLMFSYSWGRNAGVRGASSRKVVLADLNLSVGFGPEAKAPRNRTLLLVLRKGALHKDNHTTDQQVGVQRHRDYRMCTVFATAALVLMKLRELGSQVDFFAGSPRKAASWWNIPINDYSTYSEESNAMKNVLNTTGTLNRYSSKVTHHRSMCVQYGGSQGLTSEQISTVTKHKLDKLHSAYMPEVEQETLKVMSGFKKWESRFVKTEHVQFPRNRPLYAQQCTRILLPHYDRYLSEFHSQQGDHSTCAEKFLLHIIPYFIETVLQCGYWFIEDFPDHPLTQLLKEIPGYEQYAPEARDSVDLVHSTRGDVYAQAVSTATAHLLGSVREELAAVKTQQVAQEVTLNHTVTMVQDLCTALTSTVKQTVARQVEAGNRTVLAQLEKISSQQQKLQELFDHQQQQQQRVEQIRRHQQSIVDTGGIEDSGGSVSGFSGLDAVADVLQEHQSPASRNFQDCSYATKQTRIAAGMNMNAFDAMRSTPRRPICSTIFPDSWRQLYDEWQRNDLQSFLKSRQQHWEDPKLVNRYVKRHRAMRMFLQYKAQLGNNDVDDLEVLRRMDDERNDREMSLSKHILYLFNNDQTRTRRSRVARNNNKNNIN